VGQELIGTDDQLVDAAQRLICKEGQRRDITALILPTDSRAAQAHEELAKMVGYQKMATDSVFLPGFIQAGVFRYESARKAVGMRIAAFHRLLLGETRLLVTSLRGFSRFAPNPAWISSNGTRIVVGQDLELEDFVIQLERIGYLGVQNVEEVGDFAIRGGIVDIWIPGSSWPHRIEIFGDAVDEIRCFRANDGRSFRQEKDLTILPCREFCWPRGEDLEKALDKLNAVTLGQRLSGQARADLFENLRQGVPFLGIDDACASLLGSHYTSSEKFLLEVASLQKTEIRFQFCGTAAEFSEALEQDRQTFERAENSARNKGYFSTPFHSVFWGLKDKDNIFDRQLLSPDLSKKSNQKPSETSADIEARFGALKKQFEADWCRKAKGRLDLLVNLLADSPSPPQQHDSGDGIPMDQAVNAISIGLKGASSLAEIKGYLSHGFAAFGRENATTNETPTEQGVESGLPEQLFAQSPVTKSSVPQFFVGDIRSPIYSPRSRLLIVSESWLRGLSHVNAGSDVPLTEDDSAHHLQGSSRNNAEILMQAQFSEFRENDLVVHVQHGVGRFLGLATVKIGDASGDFLVVEYANKDKIYVPVDKLNLVQRYIGADSQSVTLDSLKAQTWEKKRERARKDAEKMAREMLAHHARRAAAAGHAFTQHDEEMMNFESAFPYDETPDQLKSGREIAQDMLASKSMDRLLCGDVGFGKTEVAMRAAYRAVLDGLQVAWLVPTTVLAHQHYRSAQERYASFGVRVALLDRGSTAKAQRTLLDEIAAGKVDVLIGTHRILSEDVVFRSLGLLVVDEEQRFGVIQKERIKNISYGVDVLTMTATPIPRTLQLAMLGLRDLSLLTTAPKSRLSVKTLASPFDDETIKYALDFEMQRGGQTFYVHNRVEDLASVKPFLEKLVPGIRVAIGHGQMQQKELDDVIIAFLDGKHDVLLCTTIIESGIDMPNVNTIIVQDADKFGLAQLYQLRGRVGRRSSRGYAYLLMSPGLTEKDEGCKRIELLREHQDLGSGFVIASHDLEMRGGGSIIGDSQSGHMTEVGLETYNHMLDDAMRSLGGLKSQKVKDVDLKLPIDVKIPEDYIQSPRERLRCYRKFFAAGSEDTLRSLLAECEDRFGPLPRDLRILGEIARTKRLSARIGAVSVTVTHASTEIRLDPEILQGGSDNEALVMRILDVCNRRVRDVRLTPDGRIINGSLRSADFKGEDIEKVFGRLQEFLSALAGPELE
jgi:transcription-repair coupling factor (superfamily II helicase)